MNQHRSRRSVLARAGTVVAAATIPVTGTAAAEATGTLDILLNEESVDDGEIVTQPISGIDVFDTTDGDLYSRDGEFLGETDDNGRLGASMEAGQRELTVRVKWHRYYDGKDEGIPVEIEPNETTTLEYDFLPSLAWLYARHQTEYGKALYVTGDSEYLGNWEQARRMSNTGKYGALWQWKERLPAGAEFKFVRADWTDATWISTDDVDWELGFNRVIEGGLGYPGSYVKESPEF